MPCRGSYRRPGPWLKALEHLHKSALSPREIADALNERGDCGDWTPRQAAYWLREYFGATPHRTRPDEPRRATRAKLARSYAAKRGWGRWLPAEGQTARDVAGRTVTLLELRKRETDILCLLHEHGPRTRKQLAAHLGVGERRRLKSDADDYLGRLVRSGLVTTGRPVLTSGRGRPQAWYALADGVTPNERTLRKTGVEERLEGTARCKRISVPS